MSVKPRTSIETLPPYRAARSVETLKREYGLKSITKLAANENTFGFSKNVWKALKQISSQYPDGSAYNLRSELAKKFSLPLENIVLGNGSFELLYLAGIAYLNQGDETIAALPSFGWYKSVTQILGANFTGVPLKDFHVDLTAIAGAVTEKTKIIWLCNPNNPTGTIFTQLEMENFLQKIPDRVLVILDEAYIDYVEEKDFPESIIITIWTEEISSKPLPWREPDCSSTGKMHLHAVLPTKRSVIPGAAGKRDSSRSISSTPASPNRCS